MTSKNKSVLEDTSKTVVQQLIGRLNRDIQFFNSLLKEQGYVEMRISTMAKISQTEHILKYTEKMLEEEEQQIVNAFCNAYLIGEDDISSESAKREAIEYFKYTYEK